MVAPGIENWNIGREMLLSDRPYDISAGFPVLKPSSLSANERRRTTDTIKLALQCAQEALDNQDEIQSSDPELTSVFASSSGDLNIVDKILTALTMQGKPVSPTHFHNSVHNAPAGYWSIATGSSAATTSISAGVETFSAGLLEAVTQVIVDQHPVLLIAYDFVPPTVMRNHLKLSASMGVAMLLTPAQYHYSLLVDIENSNSTATTMDDAGFEQLRQSNPVAYSLPLLNSIAQKQSTSIKLPYLHGQRLQLQLQYND